MQIDKLKLLEKWNERYTELDKSWNKLLEAGFDANSDLHNATWRTFDAYTEAVGSLVGDKHDWLTWFLYEAKQGKKNCNVVVNDKAIKVKTVKQLLKLIEL